MKYTKPHRSPQARGSTGLSRNVVCHTPPIPAGAGLNRDWRTQHYGFDADPRRRGAQPASSSPPSTSSCRSPQARGSTARCIAGAGRCTPIPAGAGLNRMISSTEQRTLADPRRRGAQPFWYATDRWCLHRSPQARGSTGSGQMVVAVSVPIPAGAGLNRMRSASFILHPPDPRRRGAQPDDYRNTGIDSNRSPQARGSTDLERQP
ncbi:hypothetical protein SAMN05443545_10874 [Aidingimonas halophila]|uniref:Uncharacterized protein n=1 Tax=Aidingimonas halophila TaxID=574349 RepID=A0A1H3FN63_9GAMM|nr:hypothetical protein SAMN05443545_10874 [Aidingimonas halophila]